MPARNIAVDVENEAASLWNAYRTDPSESTVCALVEFYLPLVRQTMSSMSVYARADMDRDDLLQHAMMGLWTTIVRFDEARGVSFRSFAVSRIRGAVLDALRQYDPLTRTDRALLKNLQQCVVDYAEQYEMAPDEEQLAVDAGISVERLHSLTERAQPVLSLDAMAYEDSEGGGINLVDRLVDENAPDPRLDAVRNERGALFRKAFRKLNDRQQKILYLYYYEELTLKEIGTILDLTEARICQLHAGALLVLRGMLQGS